MAAGMPSVGIGGLFYLASTLLLPFRRAWRGMRGERDTTNSRAVAHALLIAFGMIAGIGVAGWLLGLLVPAGTFGGAASHVAGTPMMSSRNLVRWATLAAGFVTLAVVLMAVEIARLATRRGAALGNRVGDRR